MIEMVEGDLLQTDLPILAHGCNCQGVMGSGVALAIRNAHPEAYLSYCKYVRQHADAQHRNANLLGSADIVRLSNGKTLGNLFTQQFYGRDSSVKYARPDAIDLSLRTFIGYLKPDVWIAIPKIGCGFGGLSWRDEVKPVLERVSDKFQVNFRVYQM